MPPVILVGNPNFGKSAILAALTGRYVTVSNYPGTTVELTRGVALGFPGRPAIVDTPGTKSLSPQSEDEAVTRDLLLAEPAAAVVQTGATKNPRRVLYLTAQLAELARRQILVMNLQDEARDLGFSVDTSCLEERLGIPVIPTTATEGAGTGEIPKELPHARVARSRPEYPDVIQSAVIEVAADLPQDLGDAARGVALMLHSGDRTLTDWVGKNLSPQVALRFEQRRRALRRELGCDVAVAVARARHQSIDGLLAEVLRAP